MPNYRSATSLSASVIIYHADRKDLKTRFAIVVCLSCRCILFFVVLLSIFVVLVEGFLLVSYIIIVEMLYKSYELFFCS